MIKLLKKMGLNIIISTITIYSINMILSKVGTFIPINYFSLSICSILGIPGLICYVLLLIKFL